MSDSGFDTWVDHELRKYAGGRNVASPEQLRLLAVFATSQGDVKATQLLCGYAEVPDDVLVLMAGHSELLGTAVACCVLGGRIPSDSAVLSQITDLGAFARAAVEMLFVTASHYDVSTEMYTTLASDARFGDAVVAELPWAGMSRFESELVHRVIAWVASQLDGTAAMEALGTLASGFTGTVGELATAARATGRPATIDKAA